MTTPRHRLVDPANECDYHIVSRCVRRAFLCGVDDDVRRDCSHRRDWLTERLHLLSPCFAVDIYSYTVLSNHFHLVLRHDPLAHRDWSDEEVVWRWFEAFPPAVHGSVVEELKPERRELMLGDPARVARARSSLGSMSHFMKHLKQPIARRANLEDDRTGHFFEQRFYSGALLTEEALIAAMAYVDLNPVRAKLAKRIEAIRDTSITERLQVNSAEALADYLAPVLSGLDPQTQATGPLPAATAAPVGFLVGGVAREFNSGPTLGGSPQLPAAEDDAGALHGILAEGSEPANDAEPTPDDEPEVAIAPPGPAPCADPEPQRRPRRPRPHITLADYIELVRAMAGTENALSGDTPDRVGRWLARTMSLSKRQRAYGSESALRHWIADRAMQFRETPLPA